MDREKLTIGCIGLGNMGSAICIGLAQSSNKYSIIGFDSDSSKIKALSSKITLHTASSIQELSHNSDVIIIAVKPNVVEAVARELSQKPKNVLVISIAAGITLAKLAQWMGDSYRIIRCMPNTPALIGEGMTVLSTVWANEDDMKIAQEIFKALGKVIVLPEHMMDAVTALSGSGPAYVFTFIQAMADGGVKTGLSRNDALLLAAQTVLGAAKMVLEGEEPISLRGKVASPGGTTIDAIHILEKNGFSGIVMDAIEAAYIKSKKLGEK
ncbi:MAG: pyrroline-5-carboxylate reductase [Spirochaetes bacterium]|nr:pyrroline-5-carboxylate reductase [Spirochaetota bacterium]